MFNQIDITTISYICIKEQSELRKTANNSNAFLAYNLYIHK